MVKAKIAAVVATLGLLLPVPGSAQPVVTVENVECVPIGGNAVIWATVNNGVPETTVRLHFRRLHDLVEDFYWVQMTADGNGRYWGVTPKTEDQTLDRHELAEEVETKWAAWWRAKEVADDRDPNDDLDQEVIKERASRGRHEERHWLSEMNDTIFENWLENLENEPVEYFVAVHDAHGNRLGGSRIRVTEVRDDCEVIMTPAQEGETHNLVVGETAHWQQDESVFHWLCDGVVTRVAPEEVKRADVICRTCFPCEPLFPTKPIRGEVLSEKPSYRVSPSK